MKAILFNTEEVRAILDGRKSVTRRVVKPQPPATACVRNRHGNTWDWAFWADNDEGHLMKMPYRPGDILYVRETWAECEDTGGYLYRAWPKFEPEDEDEAIKKLGLKWHPSIHMPKEAARLFLRVTGVRVERLRDITEEQSEKEGFFRGWHMTERSSLAMSARQAFMWMWDSTIKKADIPLYGWAANPWCWVIEFERISKTEALKSES